MEYLEFYSWDIKQSELHTPPFEQTRQHPAFIATEREVFGQEQGILAEAAKEGVSAEQVGT